MIDYFRHCWLFNGKPASIFIEGICYRVFVCQVLDYFFFICICFLLRQCMKKLILDTKKFVFLLLQHNLKLNWKKISIKRINCQNLTYIGCKISFRISYIITELSVNIDQFKYIPLFKIISLYYLLLCTVSALYYVYIIYVHLLANFYAWTIAWIYPRF